MGVMGVMGVVGAALSLYMWKIGVYLGAGLGGFALTTFLLSTIPGGVIENYMSRQTIIVIGTGLAVVAAIFLEDLAIVAATSISGALSTTVGVDMFVGTGFYVQIRDMITHRTSTLEHFNTSMYYMFAGTIGLAVLGAVCQLLAPSKGFGRSG